MIHGNKKNPYKQKQDIEEQLKWDKSKLKLFENQVYKYKKRIRKLKSQRSRIRKKYAI